MSRYESILATDVLRAQSTDKHPQLGAVLLDLGLLNANQLSDALILQTRESAKLGEILVANEIISQTQLMHALEVQHGLALVDLSEVSIDTGVVNLFSFEDCMELRFVAIAQTRQNIKIALSSPERRAKIEELCRADGFNASFCLAHPNQIHATLARASAQSLVERAKRACPSLFSCRSLFTRSNAALAFVLVAAILIPLWLSNGLGPAVLIWIALALIANTGTKLICIAAYLRNPKPNYDGPASENTTRLPKVSILIPLYKETQIAGRLVDRMAKLTYPKELLEVCLVCEADDVATLDHLRAFDLPYWMQIITVPHDELRTKPRALNYALDFCTGQVIGVYDAEDAPQSDQIYKVVEGLQRGGPRVACVQAALDYYNADTSWLSRCFTIEYAILFRVILQGLQRMSLPIPLGGTSVFFKRSILEKIGRWDAHNVTEDADLGIRLYRMGYRCQNIPSVTYEEANFRLIPWIKQRSRWLKGFLLTWAVHMRKPFALYRDLGFGAFLVFNIIFIGTVSAYAIAPLVLPLWLLSFGVQLPIYDAVPPPALMALILAFIFAEFTLFILGFVATRDKRLRHLTPYLITMIFYWPIGAFAAYKAFYELLTCPMYWDKTEHGVNDRDYTDEIERLTAPIPLVTKEKSPQLLAADGG